MTIPVVVWYDRYRAAAVEKRLQALRGARSQVQHWVCFRIRVVWWVNPSYVFKNPFEHGFSSEMNGYQEVC